MCIRDRLEICENGYLVCEEGKVKGVYPALPDTYAGIPVKDYGDRLLIPGLSDLHVHAPQYAFRGLGMDMELLEWLETNTFPEEAKYRDLDYAKKAYGIFAENLRKSAKMCIRDRNTTIVITGDHPTMDSDFCEDVPEDYVRKMYTVYINPAAETADPSLRREYTTFDDFPTTLAGLGVEIEGNRLGLGTNLFSDEMTLTELYGTDRMAQELQKKSKLMEEFAAGIEPEEEEVVEENLPTALVTVYEYDSMSGQLPVQISEINDAGKGIGTVNVAVWTEEDQSDLQWMQAEQQEDGTFWMNIDVPEFNYKTGEYHIDVYLVDADGNQNIIGSTIGVVY